jgi:hypothetical protein
MAPLSKDAAKTGVGQNIEGNSLPLQRVDERYREWVLKKSL